MGRNKKQPPENATKKITALASRGVRETDIAKALGTSFDTWSRWKTENDEIKKAFQEARQVEEDKLVGMLFEKAMSGSETAAMFLLKTRFGYSEGNADMRGNAVQVNITVPGATSPDEYKKQINNE